ncbi:CysB family HTH-type transcriptional regulator [Oligella urethralis]|uniref:CysB family HTH-type transcriptional regulator n=1 Tax=Oligella urethralis TaxID=90245 RepID=UPI0006614506|nr:CysB family HTH-type transcriptional regulator [Oligella urethralis]
MNLQQFRFVRETIRQNFNLTEAARQLYSSQPGVSKAIIELEDELGITIFERHGKRLRGLTEAGQQVSVIIDDIMRQVDNLKRLSDDLAENDEGSLIIGCTHAQARYFLPKFLIEFTKKFPKVRVSLSEGDPPQLANRLLHDEIDIAFATETLSQVSDIVTLDCYEWEHVLVMSSEHPLSQLTTSQAKNISLEQIQQYPLITYDRAFSGRTTIDRVFAEHGLVPDIILEAVDADVIKTYVNLNMGLGIIAGMAFDPGRDAALIQIPVGHLFGRHTTRLGLRKGIFVRDYLYEFVTMCSSQKISRHALDDMLA